MPRTSPGQATPNTFPDYREYGTTRLEDADAALERYDGGTTKVVIEIEYEKIGGITPACARCIGVVFAAFGRLPIGTVAVRFILGTHTWSQHAYGNAVDFMTGSNTELRSRIAHFVNANRGGLDVAHLLADPWFPSPLGNHYNHVHVDFFPQWGGTPPGHPI